MKGIFIANVNALDNKVIKKQRPFFLFFGVLLLIAGALCILLPVASSVVIGAFVGWLFLLFGIMQITTSLFYRENMSKWNLSSDLLVSILYIAVGYLFMTHLTATVLTLGLMIGSLFLVMGILRVATIVTIVPGGNTKGVMLVSAIVEILLGILVLASWPEDSSFFVSLLAGMQFIFNGMAYLFVAAEIKKHISK